MDTWTSDELRKIAAAEELELASLRRDGTLGDTVTIWVVRVGDDLYVRSWKGHNGAWFRATQERQTGQIKTGGAGKDVTFGPEADAAINDEIDAGGSTVAMADVTSIPWSPQRHGPQPSSWCRAQQLRSSTGRHEERFMDPVMSEDLEAVRDMVNRFMQTEVVPVMDGYEKRGEFPRELIRKAGEAGLYGAVFPESVGGTNLGYLAAAVIQEEMARNDVRFAACNNQQGSTCPSCVYFGGTPEQIKKYVPNLLAGKTIGMMALTESGGGSDAAGAMKTFARREADVYRINGQKMFASIANETDVGVLFAKTDRDAGARGITGFIVEPKKYPGWNAQPIDMLGLSNAFRTNVLFLDDFVVPVENRLGAEGEGFKIVMRALEAGRVTVAGKALGIARACFGGALRHAQERSLRGQPRGRLQMIQSDIP